MSFKSSWNEVFAKIKSYAISEGISNVSKGKPGYIPSEAPFALAFAYPLPRVFGESPTASKKKMEILIFVADADEDLAEGIDRVVDIAEKIGDAFAKDHPNTISVAPEFDSIDGNNIIASLTITMYYRR